MQRSQAFAIYALIASSILAVSVVIGLLTTQRTVPSTGSIKSVGVGVYWNQQCTNVTSSLNFGQLEPESSKNFTLYLKNEGNAILTLSMAAKNWNPTSASTYMTLTWNREGQKINPGQVMAFVITLTVSVNVQGISSFSLDIVISGTG